MSTDWPKESHEAMIQNLCSDKEYLCNRLAEAEQKIAALTGLLDEAREKAQALDWLESRKGRLTVSYNGIDGWVIEDRRERQFCADTLLAAIQAAQAGEQEK